MNLLVLPSDILHQLLALGYLIRIGILSDLLIICLNIVHQVHLVSVYDVRT